MERSDRITMAFPATMWRFVTVFTLMVAAQAARTRPIDVVLRAKWSGTPLVFEARSGRGATVCTCYHIPLITCELNV